MDKIVANVVSVDETDGIQTLGFAEGQAGQGRYAILQRSTDDQSVYFEVDDQINSACDVVNGYNVSAGKVEIRLAKPVGKVVESTFVIEYPVSENAIVESALKEFLDDR